MLMNHTASSDARLERVAFQTSRSLDYYTREGLTKQIAHDTTHWPLVVLKELVDNALDACEEHGVAPRIRVTVGDDGIAVTDNGPGIPRETIAGLVDDDVRVSSKAAYVSPTRGAQGNAIKCVIPIPFVLHGERGRVVIETRGERHEIVARADRIIQRPIVDLTSTPSPVKIGASFTVEWPFQSCLILERSKDDFLQVAENYTWLNPHLTLSMDWFGERFDLAATDEGWRKWLPSDPTSPHWYELEHLERLVAAYVHVQRNGGPDVPVSKFIGQFAGLTATTKQKRILESTDLARKSLSSLVRLGGDELDHEAVARLLEAMRSESKPVRPSELGVLGHHHLTGRLRQAGCCEETLEYRKTEGVSNGVPWVLEVAFGVHDEYFDPSDDAARGRRTIVGINFSPAIVNNPFRSLGKHQGLDAILESRFASQSMPVFVVIHLACARVQYTDMGKSALAFAYDS